MILGTCQRNRDVLNILKLYKAWSCQSIPFSKFVFLDFNKSPTSLDLEKLFYLHSPYKGLNNSSFMINKGLKVFTINTIYDYIQLLGDDCFPAHKNYLEVCCDLMEDYDIVMPKLVRSNEGSTVPDFETVDDESYINFIKSADPNWQIYYNEGAIFAKLEVFRTLRGYDETYFGWGYEDKDFIERARQYGYRIKYLDPPYYLVHSYHERTMMYSKEADINRRIYNLTLRKKLPIIRNDEYEWGMSPTPNVNWTLRKQLEDRIKL